MRRPTMIEIRLQQLVDGNSLWDVLNALEQVCFDKQGEGWKEAAEAIGKLQGLAFTYKI